jgi:hypothetical protein
MRPQAFSTSRRFTPPETLPGLFHPGNALGVLPFKGFPSLVAEHLSASHPLLTLFPKEPPTGF